ncbi:TonB-dependent receptor plug domain-containing protein [Filimonas effusa]|uniref:TonB-dependent receptor n=1 Tax=Filimonas effusa TaxID=2508721 RepID=A0A4Q1D315_9BACT|nr:TonB-dependent receptor [Filimonas effusa]RXK81792.1 TonB-dependent receptor [Filimonas effusa]
MKKIACAFAALAIAQTSFSQEPASGELNEVIVTANKREQKQNTTGKVISVITKEQLEKSTGRTIAQVLNEQAGVVINGALNNAGTVQSVYTRGASSGRTLILIDGVPVNDPSMINNEYDLNLFSVNDAERIEICKGAQSTLYGSDAIAGVINIITQKKNINKPVNLQASAAGGNYGTFRGNASVYGKAGKLSYTARYARLQTDGFSAAHDSIGNQSFENDGYKGNSSNAMIQYQANSHLLLKAFTMYNQYKTDIDAGIFADEKDHTVDNKGLNTGAGFQYKDDFIALTGNYQYTQSRRHDLSTTASNDYRSIAQFAELYGNMQLGNGFSLLQGVEYRYGSMNSAYTNFAAPAWNSNFMDTSISQGSMYTSFNYNSSHFNVELGGRFNFHSRYGSNYTYTFNPSYAFNSHYRVFGSIATGFKAPSLYQLFDAFSGNRGLRPEKSTNYELGVQQQYAAFSHRIAGFYRKIKDGIDYNNITFQYFNFLEQNVKGFEYELNLSVTKKLTLNANYTFLSGEEHTQSRATVKDSTYKYLLKRPKHSVNATIGYQLLPALYVSVNGKYVSKRFDVGGWQANDKSIGDYFILGAYAEYKLNKALKFFADARNLANREFFDIRGYNSIPFMINAGATFNL